MYISNNIEKRYKIWRNSVKLTNSKKVYIYHKACTLKKLISYKQPYAVELCTHESRDEAVDKKIHVTQTILYL